MVSFFKPKHKYYEEDKASKPLKKLKRESEYAYDKVKSPYIKQYYVWYVDNNGYTAINGFLRGIATKEDYGKNSAEAIHKNLRIPLYESNLVLEFYPVFNKLVSDSVLMPKLSGDLTVVRCTTVVPINKMLNMKLLGLSDNSRSNYDAWTGKSFVDEGLFSTASKMHEGFCDTDYGGGKGKYKSDAIMKGGYIGEAVGVQRKNPYLWVVKLAKGVRCLWIQNNNYKEYEVLLPPYTTINILKIIKNGYTFYNNPGRGIPYTVILCEVKVKDQKMFRNLEELISKNITMYSKYIDSDLIPTPTLDRLKNKLNTTNAIRDLARSTITKPADYSWGFFETNAKTLSNKTNELILNMLGDSLDFDLEKNSTVYQGLHILKALGGAIIDVSATASSWTFNTLRNDVLPLVFKLIKIFIPLFYYIIDTVREEVAPRIVSISNGMLKSVSMLIEDLYRGVIRTGSLMVTYPKTNILGLYYIVKLYSLEKSFLSLNEELEELENEKSKAEYEIEELLSPIKERAGVVGAKRRRDTGSVALGEPVSKRARVRANIKYSYALSKLSSRLEEIEDADIIPIEERIEVLDAKISEKREYRETMLDRLDEIKSTEATQSIISSTLVKRVLSPLDQLITEIEETMEEVMSSETSLEANSYLI